jgi:drug/metabolite transporter (DMT)-like permease
LPDNATTTTLKAVLTPLFWSLVFPLSKIIMRDIPPLSLVALRYVMGGVFLACVASFRSGRAEMVGLMRRNWVRMSILGFAAVAANASQVVGLNYASASMGSIIGATSPVYSAMLAAVFLRERVGPNQIAGLLLSLGGVAGIALAGEQSSGSDGVLGTILMLFGAVAYSVYTVLGKKWDADSVPVLAVSTGLGVIPFIALAVFTEPFGASIATAGLGSWLNLIALGILPTGISVIWFFSLVSRLGAARASVILYLVPVFGLVESSVLLGESLTPALLLGGIASLAGVALAQRQSGTQAPEAA